MSNREYVRNGHVISIDVDDDSRGKWHWSYSIDGEGYTEMRDKPLKSADSAMLEAELSANAQADRMAAGDAVE
ncbi:hypothetical protein [Paraburkholderia sediminicola]|jgi:hypothetical protein|uniref:hypothetical protein n=1 Tax=Paraburkholderia sediminicola TaxID=458836 RepID=UPI0038BD494F